jgi:hypothetical protein
MPKKKESWSQQETAYAEFIYRAEALVPRYMDQNDPYDREMFDVLDLDRTNDKHWLVYLMLQALVGREFFPIRRERGHPNGKLKWGPFLMLQIGAAVERFRQQQPDASWEEVADQIIGQFKHKVKGLPHPKTFRKLLPEALRLHIAKVEDRRREIEAVRKLMSK